MEEKDLHNSVTTYSIWTNTGRIKSKANYNQSQNAVFVFVLTNHHVRHPNYHACRLIFSSTIIAETRPSKCYAGRGVHTCMISCTKRFSRGDYVFCFLVNPLPICHLCKNIFQTLKLSISFIVHTLIVWQQREKLLDQDFPGERFG